MDSLRLELEKARADLSAHMASWEYAFGMGASRHGDSEHPRHWLKRARTDELEERCRDLEARIAEQGWRAAEGD